MDEKVCRGFVAAFSLSKGTNLVSSNFIVGASSFRYTTFNLSVDGAKETRHSVELALDNPN